MSETTGIIVTVVGIAISAAGMYLLSQTVRQKLGLLLVIAGFTIAGAGMLALGDDWVQERPPATVAPSESATPAS